VAQVAVGRLAKLKVFGGDYKTKDGTGVRDFLHVTDLALGHTASIKKLLLEHVGCRVYNLGTGHGYSVLDMVNAMKKASGKDIPYEIVDRRPGDVAEIYADSSLASQELGWKATRSLGKFII
jgi:UDP-glucose 4-epimerase